MERRLGKLMNVRFGYGGYQDAQFGLSVSIEGQGWGVGDFRGTWSTQTKVTEHTKWTERDRDRHFADLVRFINGLCVDAKVLTLDKLNGIPVEVVFDGNLLKEWRILKEVL